VVTLATHKQRKGVHGLAARAGVRLNESTVRPMDANLVRVTGAAEPSGKPIVGNNSEPFSDKKRKNHRKKSQRKRFKAQKPIKRRISL
jgi:hypothetical protein